MFSCVFLQRSLPWTFPVFVFKCNCKFKVIVSKSSHTDLTAILYWEEFILPQQLGFCPHSADFRVTAPLAVRMDDSFSKSRTLYATQNIHDLSITLLPFLFTFLLSIDCFSKNQRAPWDTAQF